MNPKLRAFNQITALPPGTGSGDRQWAGLTILLPVLGAAALLMAIDPVGYVGGGWDDWYYLQAARCISEHGFCIPDNHWERRLAVTLPLGLSLAVLGEYRSVLWITPAVYSFTAIYLLVRIVEDRWGARAAVVAGLVFVLTPAFSERMLHLGVDIAELTFVLAAARCFQLYSNDGRTRWAALSGALLAIAVITRPTSLAMVPVFVVALYTTRWSPHALAAAAIGFLVPLAAEIGLYWALTGNAFLPWFLSMNHTTIPTSELAPDVDLRESPLFNTAYIAGWKPSAGLSVHWTVDALINFLVHKTTIGTLATLAALLVLQRHDLRQVRLRTGLLLGGVAAFYFCALVYALAIDPKPRMFLPVLAIACVGIGVLAPRAWAGGHRAIVGALAILLVWKALAGMMAQPPVRETVKVARGMIEAYKRPLAIDPLLARMLTLDPVTARLPVHRDGSPLPVLLPADGRCDNVGSKSSFREVTVISAKPVHRERWFDPPGRPVMLLCLVEESSSDRA